MLLLDGAPYHTGSKVREYLQKLQIDVIWSGPYSYDAAPCEFVFAHLKLGELNIQQQATGKKCKSDLAYQNYLFHVFYPTAFNHMVKMIGRRLQEIPRSTCVKFWHHTTLHLFKYLYYEKL